MTYSLDRTITMIYNAPMFKRAIVIVSFLLLTGLFTPVISRADDVQTCTTTTQYNGSVTYICGISTHTPVATGLGDNLALVGILTIVSSGFLLFLSKKANQLGSVKNG